VSLGRGIRDLGRQLQKPECRLRIAGLDQDRSLEISGLGRAGHLEKRQGGIRVSTMQRQLRLQRLGVAFRIFRYCAAGQGLGLRCVSIGESIQGGGAQDTPSQARVEVKPSRLGEQLVDLGDGDIPLAAPISLPNGFEVLGDAL